MKLHLITAKFLMPDLLLPEQVVQLLKNIALWAKHGGSTFCSPEKIAEIRFFLVRHRFFNGLMTLLVGPGIIELAV
jgi:hypothetical protein